MNSRRIRRAFHRLLGKRGQAQAYAGLPFEPDDLERRLVWVFGSRATPSRWLLQELCQPLRLDASKPLGFAAEDESIAVEALPIEDFLVTTHIAPMLGVPVEAEGRLLPATLNNYLGVKPAYAFARDYREVWQPAMRRLILVRAHALQAMAGRDGLALAPSPRILIADSGGYAADLIMSFFPRARLLCLVHDGRETVRMDVDGAPPGAERGRLRAAAEATARDWACTADAMTHAYQAHAPALRRMVRYEDLIADPASCIASLRAWLGVAASARTPAPIPEPAAVASAAWDEVLSDAERAAAAEIMEPRLTGLGYES
jgi:hypothetical protein